jgi:hypothetical protein
MKFGIDYFPDAHPDRVSGRQYFADVLDLAEEAECRPGLREVVDGPAVGAVQAVLGARADAERHHL